MELEEFKQGLKVSEECDVMRCDKHRNIIRLFQSIKIIKVIIQTI